jgi:hypothetical protein
LVPCCDLPSEIKATVGEYCEIIARNIKRRGWSLGYVSAIDSNGRTDLDC